MRRRRGEKIEGGPLRRLCAPLPHASARPSQGAGAAGAPPGYGGIACV